MLKRYEFHVAE